MSTYNSDVLSSYDAAPWTYDGQLPAPVPPFQPKWPYVTYKVYDVMTSTFLGYLPLYEVTFSQQLNQAGTLSGSLLATDPRLGGVDPFAIIAPGRTFLYVDFLGVIVWAGILWNPTPTHSTHVIQVGATELYSYFNQRIQAKDYGTVWSGGSGADPQLMAAAVINDCLSATSSWFQAPPFSPSSPMPVVQTGLPTPTSGWVQASFPLDQLQTADSIIQQLCTMGPGQGFDFGIDVAYDPATLLPSPVFNLSYPRRGSTNHQTGLVIDTEQAVDYTWPIDSTQQATSVWVTGSGIGGAAFSAANANVLQADPNLDNMGGTTRPPGVAGQGYGLLERVFSTEYFWLQASLVAMAQDYLRLYAAPPATPTVTVNAFDPYTGLGQWRMGDDVRIIIPPDEFFPGGLDQWWRITSVNVTIADEGESTAVLTLNVPPTFSGPV